MQSWYSVFAKGFAWVVLVGTLGLIGGCGGGNLPEEGATIEDPPPPPEGFGVQAGDYEDEAGGGT